jgi:hypothetical protein
MATKTFTTIPKYQALLACLGIIAGVCLVECKTPDQLSIATLYLFPVAWATWAGGIRWGVVATVAASAGWGIANYATSPIYDQIGYRAWTMANDLVVYGFLVGLVDRTHRLLNEQKAATEALEKALDEVRTLECLLPVCAWCKRVRDDKGYWGQIEEYLTKSRGTLVSHGICPDCKEKSRRELRKAPVPAAPGHQET